MNRTAKNLIRIVGVVAGLGAAVWAMRDRLLPAPEVHDEPPPRFRTATSPSPAATSSDDGSSNDEQPAEEEERPSDDLTRIKGVGPVTAERLHEAGIDSFAQLASMSPEEVAEAGRTSVGTAGSWIEAAAELG